MPDSASSGVARRQQLRLQRQNRQVPVLSEGTAPTSAPDSANSGVVRREQLRLQRQNRQVPVSFGGNSSDFSARLQAPVSLGGTAPTSALDSANSGVAWREQPGLQRQTWQVPVSLGGNSSDCSSKLGKIRCRGKSGSLRVLIIPCACCARGASVKRLPEMCQ